MTADHDYVLLVDDDEIVHFLTRRVLNKMGASCAIEQAASGLEAIETIDRLGVPALVMLDIRMPGMDGHEFLGWLSAQSGFAPPPVMMLSSSDLPADKERTAQHPFVIGYCEKPLDPTELRAADDRVGAALGLVSA